MDGYYKKEITESPRITQENRISQLERNAKLHDKPVVESMQHPKAQQSDNLSNNKLDGGERKALGDQHIQEAIDKKDHAEAIRLTTEKYGLDTRSVSSISYKSDLSGDGETNPKGHIELGDKAFSSPGWLASTIGHEAIHADQAKDNRWYNGKNGVNLNEVEAYDWELKHANKHGLNTSEVKDLQLRRDGYFQKLPKNIQYNAENGVYTMPKGHENE